MDTKAIQKRIMKIELIIITIFACYVLTWGLSFKVPEAIAEVREVIGR